MFSATWPTAVRKIAASFMSRPVKVSLCPKLSARTCFRVLGSALTGLGARPHPLCYSVPCSQVTVGSKELAANHSVEQHVEVLEDHQKNQRLLQLVKKYRDQDPKCKVGGSAFAKQAFPSEFSI